MFDINTINSWADICNVFEPNALWWWRTCSTCNGELGRKFAEAFVNTFNIRMAGHTVVIHAIHGGLVMLKPGEKANWENNSGDTCLATDMGHHLMGN